MPPSIQLSNEILRLIASIDEFKGKWRAVESIKPERLQSLRRVATIESIGSSTRIEGAKLSDREVETRFREAFTGGSVYWLNDTVDGGPIAAQRHVAIRPEDTPRELWARELAPLGLDLFAEVFASLAQGHRRAVPQDHTLATWEPAIDGVPALHRPDLDLLPPPRHEPSTASAHA